VKQLNSKSTNFEKKVGIIQKWKYWARTIRHEIFALYLACQDARVPWYAKVFTGCIVAYAFSPIDLIPDAIPILGYLDDLILLPLGIKLAIKMIPKEVLEDCRQKATVLQQEKPINWWVAFIIIIIWLAIFIKIIKVVAKMYYVK